MRDLAQYWHRRLLFAAALLTLSGGALAQARTTGSLPDFAALVRQVSPAVVNISSEQRVKTLGQIHGFNVPDLPEDSPFHDFLRRFLDEEGRQGLPELDTQSLGSGFIISPDGYIVTNHHVVNKADEIVVRLSDRRELIAEVVGSDQQSDIALLKIDAKDLPTVRIAPPDKPVDVGEWVLAIGSPFGFDHSATAGIVSAKGRSLPSENYIPFIQTDVAINPGNSGGPLFNLDGEVIGVNSQIYSRTGGFMGLSFSIPIDMAMNVVQQLRTKGRVVRGWLGVLIQDVTRDLADSFGMSRPRGALVSQVLAGSPAQKAGLQPGDVILSFNGTELASSAALPPLVGTSPVDQPAKLLLLRGGQRQELQVMIGELPENAGAAMAGVTGPEIEPKHSDRLGLVVTDISEEQQSALGLESNKGVLVSQVEKGAARVAGVREQDVILMINNRKVENAEQFRKIVAELPRRQERGGAGPAQHRTDLRGAAGSRVTNAARRLRLYYRHGCHLCEDMLGQLHELGVAVDVVDVDREPELRARYQVLVPVLADGEAEICRYFLDQVALKGWIDSQSAG